MHTGTLHSIDQARASGTRRLRALAALRMSGDPSEVALARTLLAGHGGFDCQPDATPLAIFERPVQALGWALDLQRTLRGRGGSLPAVGIHVGEVTLGGSPAPAEAVADSAAARAALQVAGVAREGQVLLSGIAQQLAWRARDELPARPRLRWRHHGSWRLAGLADAASVHEVAEVGQRSARPLRSAPGAERLRGARRWPLVAAVLLAAVLALAGGWWSQRVPAPPPGASGQALLLARLNNLTGDPRYDAALDGALRVGLERSRHVELLSDAQVADTLARMQRSPDTPLDREIASEVAIREGARAVVLPTLAAVGGSIRITLQALDPASGMSIATASADAEEADEVLAALDLALGGLRTQLGESLAAVAATSQPLERVTSPDLEALRAYSLGVRAASAAAPETANALFSRALELDPGFAAAHARLATYHLQAGDRAEAFVHVEAAHANRERLGTRDRLYVDGYRAFFGTPAQMLASWSEFATRFPDDPLPRHNLGYVHLLYGNDFANAIPHFEFAARSQAPIRRSAMEALVMALLGAGRLEEAGRWVQARAALEEPLVFHGAVDLALARGELARAESLLGAPRHTPFHAGAMAHALRLAAVALERGQPDRGGQALAVFGSGLDLRTAAEARARLRLAQHAVAGWQGRLDRAALGRLVARETARLQAAPRSRDFSPLNHLLIAAVLAARGGDIALAETALAAAAGADAHAGFPDREAWLSAARAELALARADPAAALRELRDALAHRLYYAHVLALRAQLAAGDLDSALAEAEWLQANRGQMLGEYLALHSALLLNVSATSEALLAAAEQAHREGDAAAARRLLAPLLAGWHDGDQSAAPVGRAHALAALLR